MSRRLLPAASVEFRKLLIDALWRPDSFGYLDQDRFIGTCLVCGGSLLVRFHGNAPRADLVCELGCAETEVATAIRELQRGARA